MKTMGLKAKLFTSALLLVASAGISFYFWFQVLPAHHIKGTLDSFESAFYDNRPMDAFSYVSKRSSLAKRLPSLQPEVERLFSLFERGYHITSVGRTKSTHWDDGIERTMIWATFSKVAKIDGKKRDYFEVDLVEEGGEWKIVQYAFPDFIDYE